MATTSAAAATRKKNHISNSNYLKQRDFSSQSLKTMQVVNVTSFAPHVICDALTQVIRCDDPRDVSSTSFYSSSEHVKDATGHSAGGLNWVFQKETVNTGLNVLLTSDFSPFIMFGVKRVFRFTIYLRIGNVNK